MVKNMNENKEFLVLIHENVKMGLTSTKKLLSLLLNTNNKIKGTLESELKTYESLYNKTKKEIKKQAFVYYVVNPQNLQIL